jgi:hypothetical protein
MKNIFILFAVLTLAISCKHKARNTWCQYRNAQHPYDHSLQFNMNDFNDLENYKEIYRETRGRNIKDPYKQFMYQEADGDSIFLFCWDWNHN